MEPQFKLTLNGQEIQLADVNMIAAAAAHADDRVFAELYRMTPYNGASSSKAILPYGPDSNYAFGTVVPGSPAGRVAVLPFRAVVGSRAADITVDDFFRDIRSAVYVPAAAAGTMLVVPDNTLAGNTFPRWDLIYATISIDVAGTPTARYYKDPTSGVVTVSSTSTTQSTNVSITYISGTPNVSPAIPALPADSATVFNIPLAAIQVSGSFTIGSPIGPGSIYSLIPTRSIHHTQGVPSLGPVSSNTIVSGAFLNSWSSTGIRPDWFMPSTMIGGTSKLIYLNLASGATSSGWSHQSAGIIDNSIDWKRRLFRYTAMATTSSSDKAAWNPAALTSAFLPRGDVTPSTANGIATGVGQSFIDTGVGPTGPKVVTLNVVTGQGGGGLTAIYVEPSDGSLRFYASGVTTPVSYFVWLDASAIFTNSF